jgi:hypothetical protein
MAFGIGAVVAARNADAGRFGHGAVNARAIVARLAREARNIAIRWAWPRRRRGDFDDRSDRRLLAGGRHSRRAERDIMHAPVDAIDDEAETLAEFVGQPLVDDPADNPRRGLLAMEGIALHGALLAARLERTVDRLDDIAAAASAKQAQIRAARIMALKKKRNAKGRTP